MSAARAWSTYHAHTKKANRDPSLWEDDRFVEQNKRLHCQLVNAMLAEDGRSNIIPFRRKA